MSERNRYRRLKKMLTFLSILVLIFIIYVAYVNRNTTNMNLKQKISKAVYPLFMGVTRLIGKTIKP